MDGSFVQLSMVHDDMLLIGVFLSNEEDWHSI